MHSPTPLTWPQATDVASCDRKGAALRSFKFVKIGAQPQLRWVSANRKMGRGYDRDARLAPRAICRSPFFNIKKLRTLSWRIATLPYSSTIASSGLNFCVRNGNRCTPTDKPPGQNAQLYIAQTNKRVTLANSWHTQPPQIVASRPSLEGF